MESQRRDVPQNDRGIGPQNGTCSTVNAVKQPPERARGVGATVFHDENRGVTSSNYINYTARYAYEVYTPRRLYRIACAPARSSKGMTRFVV